MKLKDIMPNAGGFTALAVTIASLTVCAVEPIAYWNMESVNSDGTVSDASGNGRSLALEGAASVMDGELAGKALFFDGMNRTHARTELQNLLPRFTFAAWLKVPVDKNTDVVDPSNANSYPRVFQTSVGNPRVQYGSSTNDLAINTYYSAESDSVRCANGFADKGRWTHFAVTYDVTCDNNGNYATHPVWYVNGERIGDGGDVPVTIAESGDSRSTYFGISPDVSCIIGGNGGNRPFYGFMSDIWLIEKFSKFSQM